MCHLFNNIMRMHVHKTERCIYTVHVYSKLMYFELVLYKFIEDLFQFGFNIIIIWKNK